VIIPWAMNRCSQWLLNGWMNEILTSCVEKTSKWGQSDKSKIPIISLLNTHLSLHQMHRGRPCEAMQNSTFSHQHEAVIMVLSCIVILVLNHSPLNLPHQNSSTAITSKAWRTLYTFEYYNYHLIPSATYYQSNVFYHKEDITATLAKTCLVANMFCHREGW
jgi:hypothetical protein